MSRYLHSLILGVSVLPALLVLPATAAETITTVTDITGENYSNVADGGLMFSGINNTYGKGALTVTSGVVDITGDLLSFDGNTSSLHGAGFYYKDQTGTTGAVLGTNGVSFTNNTSGSNGNMASSGGAVLNTGGSMSILGATNTFTGNKILGSDANSGKWFKRGGGAIANQSYENESTHAPIDSIMIIGKSNGSSTNTFSGNTSSTNGGAIMNRAVDTDGNATLTVNGTTSFANNTAELNGGAIYNVVRNGKTAIVNLNNGEYTFTNNTANGTGGAIYNEGTLSLNHATFGGNAESVNNAVNGGAIYNFLNLNDSFEVESQAELIVNNSTFDSNTSEKRGGAIYNYGSTTIDGATFTRNHTTGGTWESQGGAIFNSGDDDYLDSPTPTLVISNTTFGNANDNTMGNSAMQGGAIANEHSLATGNITLNNVNFYYNSAYADTDDSDGYNSTLGGAVWNQGDIIVNGATMFKGNTATGYNVEGGAIYNSGTITFNDTVTFDSNIATDLNSGDGAYGGALAVSYSGETTFKKFATFTNNKALSSAEEDTQGGAINNQNTVVFEKGASFSGNQAVYGGAIFNEESLTIGGGNTIFANNIAGDEGGAIFNYIGNVSLANSSFTGNSAVSGGAFTTYGGRSTLSDITFSGNSATVKGGAIYNNRGNITFSGTNTFTGNTVVENANDIYNTGAITFATGSVTTMDGGIDGNGNLTIADAAILNLNGANVNQTSINNAGIINLTNNASVSGVTNSGTVNLTNATTDTIANSGTIVVKGTMDSIGSVVADGENPLGTLQIASGASFDAGNHLGSEGWALVTVVNNGTLDISALSDAITLTNNSTLNIWNDITTGQSLGGDINVRQGTLASTSVLSGSNLNVANDATANLINATLTGAITNYGTLSSSTGAVSANSLVNTNSATFASFTGTGTNSSIVNSGTLTSTGAVSANSLTNTNDATLASFTGNAANSGHLIISGNLSGATLSNNVEAAVTELSTANLSGDITNYGTLTSSGLVRAQTLRNNNTATLASFAGNVVNTGNLAVDGALTGATLSNAANARTELSTATLTGNITNYGTLTSSGLVRAQTLTNTGVATLNTFNGNVVNIGETANATFDNVLSGDLTNTGTALLKHGMSGVLYNTGDVTFGGGNSIFADGIGGQGNIIINNGAGVTIGSSFAGSNITNNGNLTINGGDLSAAQISGNGNLVLNGNYNLGDNNLSQHMITINGDIITELKSDSDYRITADEFAGEGSFTVAVNSVGTYKVFGNAIFANTIIESDFIDNPLYNINWNDSGKDIIAARKSADEIAGETEIEKDTAEVVLHVADAADAEGASQEMKDLSEKLQERLLAGDTEAIEHATQAIHPEKESVVQSVTTSVQNTIVNLASARMAMPTVGRNGGDLKLTSGGIWAQGLINASKQADAFNGTTRGIAAGLDGTINKHWTIGAGYSFARSDIDGTARNTKIDSNTVFVYGQYKPDEWYLNAVANYTMSDYSENGTVIENIPVFADFRVKSFGGNVATGYDFKSGITPELSLRFMHVSAEDYANSYGIKTHMDDTNFLTAMAGGRYVFNVNANKHLKFAPQLSGGIKYDLISDKNIATITMPGLTAYSLEANRLSRAGAEVGIGLGMQYRNVELSANYDIDIRDDYTSQTGMLKFRCNF